MLKHFEKVRSQYPLTTRGIIVVLDINTTIIKNWKPILDKYLIIHTNLF